MPAFNFLNRNKSLKRIGIVTQISLDGVATAPGFTPSPNPAGGTNYSMVGPASGTITITGGSAVPSTLLYSPNRTREIRVVDKPVIPKTADVFLCAGGGFGGGCGDYGQCGGGGGGGIVYRTGITLSAGVGYATSAAAGGNDSVFDPGGVSDFRALRGGNGAPRQGVGGPGGNGGGYTSGDSIFVVGTGFQRTFPNPFLMPQPSATYGYGGNPGSGFNGGSSPFTVPAPLLNPTPLAPIGATGFGLGQGITAQTGPNGSGRGGSGSNPPGNTNLTAWAPGSVIIRVY